MPAHPSRGEIAKIHKPVVIRVLSSSINSWGLRRSSAAYTGFEVLPFLLIDCNTISKKAYISLVSPLHCWVGMDNKNSRSCKTVNCSNIALIQSDEAKYGSLCQFAQSVGWNRRHNCDGKSYYCVKCGSNHCLVSDLAILRKTISQKHRIADMRNRRLSKPKLWD